MTVTDGPFTEAKEVIAGFALVKGDSKEEAITWASRFAAIIGDVEVEVRQVAEFEDFDPEVFPAEARAREQALRDHVAES